MKKIFIFICAILFSALACIGFLAGSALVCAVIAYLRIRKRNI